MGEGGGGSRGDVNEKKKRKREGKKKEIEAEIVQKQIMCKRVKRRHQRVHNAVDRERRN